MHHARREIQVLLCGNPQHILNDAGMERASPLASGEHIAHIQEEHFGLLAGNNVAKQLLAGNCRIVFCKNLSFSHMTENMAVSPVKIDDDINTAGFHKPDFADRGPRPDNNLILFVFALFRSQAAKQLRDFALADSMKQRRVGKKKIFMKIILPLLQQHTRCFGYSIIRAENQEQGGKTYGKHSCKQENLDR